MKWVKVENIMGKPAWESECKRYKVHYAFVGQYEGYFSHGENKKAYAWVLIDTCNSLKPRQGKFNGSKKAREAAGDEKRRDFL